MIDERGAPDATLAVWLTDDTRDETLAFIERMGGGEEWCFRLRMGGVEAEHVELVTSEAERVLAARLVEQSLYVDDMREALRRLGDDAERLVADGAADREATPEAIERLWGIATAAFAAACLYAPKESGQ